MVLFKMEEQENIPLEDGEYDAVLANLQEQAQGKFGPCVRFVFSVSGGQYDGVSASTLCAAKLTPGNKLDTILRALGSEPLEVGETIDGENLIGKPCRIYVEPKEQNGKTYNNVVKVKPPRAGTPVAAAPAAAPAAPAAAPTTTNAPAPTTNTPNTGVKEVKPQEPNKAGVNVVDDIDF